MNTEDYIEALKPLSIHARFGVALRIFERYIRVRGIEDDSVWIFLEHMWRFPTTANKNTWEKERGDLADFGLGDEVPEELEEELATLGIDEDYFDQWVTCVVEIAWQNILKGPHDGESLDLLRQLIYMAEDSGLSVPDLTAFQDSLYSQNNGWGELIKPEQLEQWQSAPFPEGSGGIVIL